MTKGTVTIMDYHPVNVNKHVVLERKVTKQEFEANAKQLEGERLIDVRYFRVHDDNVSHGEAIWAYNAYCHLLDYGLELEFESGRVSGIIWGCEFESHNISVHHHSLVREVLCAVYEQATCFSSWQQLIGKSINCITVHWDQCDFQGYGEPGCLTEKKVSYPWCIEMQFEGASRIFACAAIPDTDGSKFSKLADAISVFFDPKTMAKAGLDTIRVPHR